MNKFWNVMTYVVKAVVFLIGSYILTAVVMWEPNVANWPWVVRFVMLFFAFVLTGISKE